MTNPATRPSQNVIGRVGELVFEVDDSLIHAKTASGAAEGASSEKGAAGWGPARPPRFVGTLLSRTSGGGAAVEPAPSKVRGCPVLTLASIKKRSWRRGRTDGVGFSVKKASQSCSAVAAGVSNSLACRRYR